MICSVSEFNVGKVTRNWENRELMNLYRDVRSAGGGMNKRKVMANQKTMVISEIKWDGPACIICAEASVMVL